MSYCQECGSYIEPNMNNCGSCGNKLIDVELTGVSPSEASLEGNQQEAPGNALQSSDTLSPTEPTVPAQEGSIQKPEVFDGKLDESSNTSTLSVFKESPSKFSPQEGISVGSHWNQMDSHLGKGLIKPVAIENCMDGYHFRYDEPPCQITKPEPQKEKAVEFRFSAESNLSDEAGKVVGTNEAVEINEEEVSQEHPNTNGVEPEKDEPEVVPEQIAEPGQEIETTAKEEDNNPTEDTQDEGISVREGEAPVAEVSLQENNLPSEVDAEPETSHDTKPEIIWKGHRSWYGLALKEEYRVTAQSLVIMNDSGQVLKEIEWRFVSQIELKQNWLSKWLNIGNLDIIGTNSELLITLEGVEDPEQLQKMLVETVCFKV